MLESIHKRAVNNIFGGNKEALAWTVDNCASIASYVGTGAFLGTVRPILAWNHACFSNVDVPCKGSDAVVLVFVFRWRVAWTDTHLHVWLFRLLLLSSSRHCWSLPQMLQGVKWSRHLEWQKFLNATIEFMVSSHHRFYLRLEQLSISLQLLSCPYVAQSWTRLRKGD